MAVVYPRAESPFFFFLLYPEDGWSICKRTVVADIPRRWLVNIQIGFSFALKLFAKDGAANLSHSILLSGSRKK
jgi:hypothetical protein